MEFTPTANQVGMSHSFNAKVVINSVIDDEGETEQTNTAGQGAGGNTPGGELEG